MYKVTTLLYHTIYNTKKNWKLTQIQSRVSPAPCTLPQPSLLPTFLPQRSKEQERVAGTLGKTSFSDGIGILMSMPLPRLELDWLRDSERDWERELDWLPVGIAILLVLTWIPCHHRCHWQQHRLYLWPGRPSLSRLYQTENLPFPYHRVTAKIVYIYIYL